ncbi:MAG: hypothetical protein HYZ39_02110 [Mycolicibacterium cosmeticum]|nr:hypothetical protein [Mycolicibacterium cosmeticum]
MLKDMVDCSCSKSRLHKCSYVSKKGEAVHALSDVRERVTPVVALAGAIAIATATVVSSPPVQRAAESTVQTAVHEVRSVPLQLTSSVDFFAPYYYMPAGPIGTAITIPLFAVTYVADTLAKTVTQTLIDLHVDPRLAEVPAVVSRVVFTIAGRVQGGVVSALDGTYVLGRFTPIQAINFIIEPIKEAIEAFVAAGKNLLDPSLAVAATAKAADTSQDVASPTITTTKAVTLSTAQADVTPTSLHTKKEPDAVAAAEVSDASSSPVDDTEKSDAPKVDTPKADTATADAPTVKKPTWKKPTLKLPKLKLKLPTLKFPGSEKATSAGQSSERTTKDAGSEESSK